MTALELTLIIIIWISYGLFAAYQTDEQDESQQAILLTIYVLFSPIIFIIKSLYGAFKKYE